MQQIVKLNILIPLQYDKEEYNKTVEPNQELSKEQIESCKQSGVYNCAEWFHYCFRKKPIENNFQMINSPLVTDRNYQISRIELDSVVRDLSGLHKNENTRYVLEKSKIEFQFGKIRVIFTKSRIAFLHFEILATNLSQSDTRSFINSFSHITNNQPQIVYKKRLSKYEEKTVKANFKDIILTIINLQSYVPLYLYENKIIPYFQICLDGDCEDENKLMFFDSIRSLSKRPSTKEIDKAHIYIGKEPYISRFVGDRTACIYGDTKICGDENIKFITDIGNGLIKTATENYTTVYAFLISLNLLIRRNDVYDTDLEYLINAPLWLSDEDNIREFFEQCLLNEQWKLTNAIQDIKNRVQNMTINPVKPWSRRWENKDKPKTNSNVYFEKKPFVFISYGHENREVLEPLFIKLQELGVRIWYDNRINPSDVWPDEIGWNIIDCRLFIILLSHASILSINVRQELTMANSRKKELFGIAIEELKENELSPGMELQLGLSQRIEKPLPQDELIKKIYRVLKDKYPSVCE